MFFFSIGAGDMIQVHHTLHRFFFISFSLVMFRFSWGVYIPHSPYRSTRPQESRTTWSFMSMWRGWMGQGFSLDYTISLLVFVGFYSFICMRYYESMDE